MNRRLVTVALGPVVATVALVGCGSDTAGGTAADPHTSASTGTTSLTVTAKAGPDAAADSWTLTCDPAGGSHPDPQAACAALAAAKNPFGPVPKNVACTEVYGGPQTATVTGTYQGKPVSATYSRTNGCEIARWDALAPLLVVKGGA